MMNKKGLMVQYLTTLLLAIIIFVPACLLASSMFRLSDQAKENFGDFVNEINEVAAAPEGEKRNFMLIMDENTAIIKFDKNKEKVKSDYVRIWESKTVSYVTVTYYHSPYPEQYCKGNDCLVLCREVLSPDSRVGLAPFGALTEQTVQKSIAEITPIQKKETDYFNIDYSCSTLVPVILDEDIKVLKFSVTRTADRPRRVLVELEKTKQGVRIVKGYEKDPRIYAIEGVSKSE